MAKKFNYGGQAVIEGVMIRGRQAAVTAVRRPGGGLVTKVEPLAAIYTGWMRRAPFIRGVIVLLEAMVLGIKSLLYSANVSLEDEEEEITGKAVWLMIALALALAIVLFLLVPLFLTRLINPYLGSSLLFHLVEGLIRLVIFIAYLKIVGLMPDIRRVFTYHGAEHKAVNAYEAGVPMEVEAVKKHDTAHVRCGTSFLFVVLIIAILVFAVVGRPTLWLMVLSRVVLIPVIASLGYEVIYFGARHHHNALVRVVLAPGLWLQGLTAKEPDDSQLEIALAALREAVDIDQREEAAQT
jgi:uncharacterized protein YqhQ